jgi:hypothetical protein
MDSAGRMSDILKQISIAEFDDKSIDSLIKSLQVLKGQQGKAKRKKVAASPSLTSFWDDNSLALTIFGFLPLKGAIMAAFALTCDKTCANKDLKSMLLVMMKNRFQCTDTESQEAINEVKDMHEVRPRTRSALDSQHWAHNELLAAVDDGTVSLTTKLLLGVVSSVDSALLFKAASLGKDEMIPLLLSAGAQINTLYTGSGTALCIASKSGHVPTVAALLAAPDVDVDKCNSSLCNSRSTMCRPPLFVAAAFGNDEIVQLLLTAGADVNKRCANDTQYGPALWMASQLGDLSTVKVLLTDPGIEIDKADIVDDTVSVDNVLDPYVHTSLELFCCLDLLLP